MGKIPDISESEQQVMKVIWNDNPITAVEITKELAKTTAWKFNTIKTFINRLLKKGAIGFEKSGKEYSYYPLIREADYAKSESSLFLNRIFGGAMKPMLLTMVENKDLTLQDIEALRKHLLEKKKER